MSSSASRRLGDRRVTVRKKLTGRSVITNGHKLLPNSDGRLAINRRIRDINAAILSDLGGVDNVSEVLLQASRRFSSLSALCEKFEAKIARDEDVNVTEYALLISTAVRVIRHLGTSRVARDITPSLDQYLQQRRRQPLTIDQQAEAAE